MKENLKIKAVLVDFDGTLFDTWSNPYARGEKKFDWKVVEKNIPNCALYEGWKGVFAWLKSKQIPLGIVSHCTKGYITKTLKYWGLTDVFSCLLTRYGNGTRYSGKVSKDKLISLALQEDAFKGIEAGEVLYLSDQVKDMSITRNAGAIPIGCLWGSKEKQELEKEGCITLDAPLELIQLIKNQLNIKNMEIIRKKLEEHWLVESLDEWDFSHDKYSNYVAINTKDEEGNDKYEWLKSSKNDDEYFNFYKVKKGDILMVGCKNRYKKRTEAKAYYGVVNKTDDAVELIKDTTYLRVKKRMKEI